VKNDEQVVEESGRLLFISGLSNALGYIFYTFAGQQFMTGGALLGLLSALLLLASLIASGLRWSKRQKFSALASAVFLIVLQFTWKDRDFYAACWLKYLSPRDQVITFKSRADSATLIRFSSGLEWVTYNGHTSIFVRKDSRINPAEMISGVIPGLYAPRHDKALVLGIGTGISSGVMSSIFKSTDVVDLNGAFFKMLPEVSYANLNLLQNSSVALHLCDGRVFLIGKEGVYDAILNTTEAPDYFAAPKLYTVEFYQRAARALKPDGVFCTWVSTPEMSEEGIELVLSALRKSFAYCDLALLESSYCQFTCSNRPLHMQVFSKTPASADLREQLGRSIPGFTLDEYFEDIRLRDNLFANYRSSVTRENTDDYPALEFAAVREAHLKRGERDLFSRKPELFNIDVVKKEGDLDPARLAKRAITIETINRRLFESLFVPVLRKDRDASVHYLLLKAKRITDQYPASGEARKLIEAALAMDGENAEACYALGNILASSGDRREAAQCFRKAMNLKPGFREARKSLQNLWQKEKLSQ
jgi:tetratricopeptide (TPR) repeat protein